jgi:hypothetical protein
MAVMDIPRKDHPVAVPAGAMKTVAGRVEIYSGAKWLHYPAQAATLIEHAIACGWFIDDGLPIRHREDGSFYIRAGISRSAGPVADSKVESNSWEFHLTWNMKPGGWEFGSGYYRTDDGNPEWRDATSLKWVRRIITTNRIKTETQHIEANN